MPDGKKLNEVETENVAGGGMEPSKEKSDETAKNAKFLVNSSSVRKCIGCGKEFTVHYPDAGKLMWQDINFCSECRANGIKMPKKH